MCLLFSADTYQASSTLLIVSPLRTPPSRPQAWQLVYINNISPKSSIPNGFGSNHDKRPDAFGFGLGLGSPPPSAPLMIVPLPNPHALREQDFTLFPVSKSTAANLRAHATALAKPYLPAIQTPSSSLFGSVPAAASTFGFGAVHPPPLLVQHVGDYNISIAPSLSDLQTRAPWKRFSIPSATVSRLVAEVTARYPRRYAFIVAEGASGGVQQAGFAVQYRDATANGVFFPTAHEPPEYASPIVPTTVAMDVTLVALGAVLRPLSILPPARYASLGAPRPQWHTVSRQHDPPLHVWCPAPGSVVLRGDDSTCRGLHAKRWASVTALLSELPTVGGGQLHKGKLIEHKSVRLVTSWQLDGAFPNGDVVARKATKEDVDVVDRDTRISGRGCTTGRRLERGWEVVCLALLWTCPRARRGPQKWTSCWRC